MIGGIIIWSGLVSKIPNNFHLCDGTHGTPDLRARFISCAATDVQVGVTGGSVVHNHPFTGDGHTHTLGVGPDITSGFDISKTTNLAAAHGTTDNSNHLPPYMLLAFIMQIA